MLYLFATLICVLGFRNSVPEISFVCTCLYEFEERGEEKRINEYPVKVVELGF
jgi:hypothetical protein